MVHLNKLFLLKEISFEHPISSGTQKMAIFHDFELCYCSYRPRELLNSKINISYFSQVFQLKILILFDNFV